MGTINLADHEPRADLLVLGMESGCRALLSHLQPLPSQNLVLLLIDPENYERWECVLWDQGTIASVDEVMISTSGILSLSSNEPNARPSDTEKWSRLEPIVGSEGLAKIQGATVTVVGVSRLGTEVASLLSTLGVQRLRLIDNDVVEPQNLSGIRMLPVNSAGTPKVRALAMQLQTLRPELDLSICDQSALSPGGRDFLRHRSDLIVTCVDSMAARQAVARMTHDLITPHLDVASEIQRRRDGTLEMFGDARLLQPGDDGCMLCVGGPEANVRGDLWYEMGRPESGLIRGPRREWSDTRAGSSILLNSMLAGMGVQMWIDAVTEQTRGSRWLRLNWSATPEIIEGSSVGNGPCPICGRD
ncbi:MAG: ThiF family adenylyltransferase [Planctomycetaceae bacterium]|nr:ThiF family adenylyltransferase [Planctomycetaceae bacterium]